IQPGVLKKIVLAANNGGEYDDGLLQRFQLLVYPDLDPSFENVDRPPDVNAQAAMAALFNRFACLSPEELGAEADDDPERNVPYLRFEAGAQKLFNSWRTDLEFRVRSGEETPTFSSHLAKYRSLVPAIALIYHLAAGWSGPVRLEALTA